ncbi:MAG TPA: hypothetical protein VFQ44_01215 [Streptosporangiaceae bacterium]|nr:hypothetical protein [Streptosporangiaceae bacterium]
MTPGSAHLDHARKVADAILHEGYLLYPYHQSSRKNQSRFQFGVLMPAAYAQLDPTEPSASQTQCLLECRDDARVRIQVRFLQSQRRRVRDFGDDGEPREIDVLVVDEEEFTAWDEAVEREEHVDAGIAELLSEAGREYRVPFSVGPQATAEDLADRGGRVVGQLTRTMTAVHGMVTLRADRVAGPFGAVRLTVRTENLTTPDEPVRCREDGLRYALIATHALIWVPGGKFISMTDPPEWAAAEVAACVNTGTWPVLAGPPACADLMLSSPVILYDHVEVAPESGGDLFDATEIDEILTLRTLALTDAEKRAARATDPRARELMDRLEGMPQELFGRLHGAIRYSSAEPGTARPADAAPERRPVPWWDPGSDTAVSPRTDQVIIGGIPVARGSKVIMRPGGKRADAQDLFLVGRPATVEAVLFDVDQNVHVAVTPDDDPAADLQRAHGRFLYFATDEIEPVRPAEPTAGTRTAG